MFQIMKTIEYRNSRRTDVRMYGNMAVDADGNIYIGDNNKKRIVIYGSNGQLVDTFKIQGTENRYISVSDLMVYDSNLYVLVDGKLQKYTLNGKYLEYWRLKDGVAASALAMGADGNVYVTDTNGWVCKYLHTSIEDTAVDGIALDQHQLILKLKKFTRLQATVTPRNTTEDDSVIWSSSDENIAMVDQSGKVIGKFPGSAVITATTVSGGYQDSCNVAVYPDYSFCQSQKSYPAR